MSRSPLPALRRLFAAGGAPAASHATLSRAPAPERLLEPMAHVGMTAGSSLDALARPLELEGVLGQALNARQPENSNNSAGEAPRRSKRQVSRGSSADAGSRGHAPVGTSASAAADRLAARSQVTPASSTVDRTSLGGHRHAPDNSVAADGVTAIATSDTRDAAAPPTRAPAARELGIDARTGADARVIVDQPVAGIDRLLALGDPSDGGAASRRSRRVDHVERASGDGVVPRTAGLLENAVARAGERRSGSAAPEPRRVGAAASAPVHQEMLIPEQSGATSNVARVARRSDGGANIAASTRTGIDLPPDATAGGGFRGLARRALTASDAREHLPVRLEPEVRIPSDLPLDNFDARVAESLARLLEREARRHGVDFTEAGV